MRYDGGTKRLFTRPNKTFEFAIISKLPDAFS